MEVSRLFVWQKKPDFFTFFSIDNWHCRVILVRYVIKQLESELFDN